VQHGGDEDGGEHRAELDDARRVEVGGEEVPPGWGRYGEIKGRDKGVRVGVTVRARVGVRARVRVNALALDDVEHHRGLEELLALVFDDQLLDRGRLAVLVVHGDGPLGKRPARLLLLLP